MAGNSPTPAERAKAFLQGVLDKIPAEHRASVEAGLINNPEAATLVGGAILRQDEFSRSKDALTQERVRLDQRQVELDTWFADSQPIVERAKAIIDAGGNGNPVVDPNLDPAGDHAMPAADLTKLQADIEARTAELVRTNVIQSERNAIPFITEVTTLAIQHLHTFGEPLDIGALTNDPRVYDGKTGLRGTYDALYGDRYKAKSEAARQAELDAAKAAGAAEATAALTAKFATDANPMYPTSATPSPMGEALAAVQQVGADGKTAPRDFRNRVDERVAAAEYATLVSSGASAGG